jgi:hypothetical protein
MFVWSGEVVKGISPFLPLPSTLNIDRVEQQNQTVLVDWEGT